jgi:hypothetical protein
MLGVQRRGRSGLEHRRRPAQCSRTGFELLGSSSDSDGAVLCCSRHAQTCRGHRSRNVANILLSLLPRILCTCMSWHTKPAHARSLSRHAVDCSQHAARSARRLELSAFRADLAYDLGPCCGGKSHVWFAQVISRRSAVPGSDCT